MCRFVSAEEAEVLVEAGQTSCEGVLMHDVRRLESLQPMTFTVINSPAPEV